MEMQWPGPKDRKEISTASIRFCGQYEVLNMRVGEKTNSLHLQRNSKYDLTPARFSKPVSFISDQFHVHVLTQIQSLNPMY